MRRNRPGQPTVVLQSFPDPRPTTNPYLVMLGRSLAALPDVRLRTFAWRRALLGRYDVFHVHWPEILVSGHSPLKKLAQQGLFVLLLLRLRLCRIPLVRTAHNLELPSGISRREVWLLRWAERATTLRIRLNETTPVPPGTPSVTILHGHYRDWFAGIRTETQVPGRIAFVGLIRRYKNVGRLIEAFAETADEAPDLTLRVAGHPSTQTLVDELVTASSADPRVSLSFGFLDDAELVAEITGAELVVLPYREMHNSGGVLAALSLGRPVLAPDNPTNRLLAAEVGPGWVHCYTGQLTGQSLLDTLAAVRTAPAARPPDLDARGWQEAGAAHLAAYRSAIAQLHGR